MDVLIRCDAHAAYPPGYVRRLLESLQQSGAGAVVVPMDSAGDTCMRRAIAWVSDTPIGSGGSAHRGGHASGFVDHGHHAAFRIDVVRSGRRLRREFQPQRRRRARLPPARAGSHVSSWTRSIRVVYQPRSSLGGLWRQYMAYGRGRSRTVRKHPGSLRARQLAVPMHLAVCAVALSLQPLVRRHCCCGRRSTWVCSWRRASTLALRRRSLCGLLSGPAAFVMHTAWALGFFWGLLSLREQLWRPEAAAPLWLDNSLRKLRVSTTPVIRALLVDPSLFTAPYDAALTEGLLAAGVDATWATRPTRRGDRQEIPKERVDAFFYRWVDEAAHLPRRMRAVAKGVSHLIGLCGLVLRVFRRRPDIVHFQWTVLPHLDAIAILIIRLRRPVVLTVHDPVPFNGERRSWLQTAGFDLPIRLANRVIVHTQAGRRTLLGRGVPAEKVAVIPHGPLRLSVPLPGKRGSARTDEDRWTFLLFGEIKPYKGIDLLIEALGLLPEATPTEGSRHRGGTAANGPDTHHGPDCRTRSVRHRGDSTATAVGRRNGRAVRGDRLLPVPVPADRCKRGLLPGQVARQVDDCHSGRCLCRGLARRDTGRLGTRGRRQGTFAGTRVRLAGAAEAPAGGARRYLGCHRQRNEELVQAGARRHAQVRPLRCKPCRSRNWCDSGDQSSTAHARPNEVAHTKLLDASCPQPSSPAPTLSVSRSAARTATRVGETLRSRVRDLLPPEPIRGKGYKLVQNWDFGVNIRDETELRQQFHTRYIYDNGRLDHLNDEWPRYRDNANHVFLDGNLALVARVQGGRKTGRSRKRNAAIEVVRAVRLLRDPHEGARGPRILACVLAQPGGQEVAARNRRGRDRQQWSRHHARQFPFPAWDRDEELTRELLAAQQPAGVPAGI